VLKVAVSPRWLSAALRMRSLEAGSDAPPDLIVVDDRPEPLDYAYGLAGDCMAWGARRPGATLEAHKIAPATTFCSAKASPAVTSPSAIPSRVESSNQTDRTPVDDRRVGARDDRANGAT
jgi:hypothetical protein